jgi:urea transport system permease protein
MNLSSSNSVSTPRINSIGNLNDKGLGAFIGCLFFCLFFLPLAEARDFESTVKGLGEKSRAKLKQAVVALGTLGDARALPILEALKKKRLRVTEDKQLVILDVSGDRGNDALSGKAVDLKELSQKKPKVNNSVRRVLAVAIAKLKLSSKDSTIRLSAAQELLKRPSNSVTELIETALKIEMSETVRETLSMVLAKLYLNSEDRSKRLTSLKTIKEIGGSSFKLELEDLLEKDENGKYLESDKEIRTLADKAIKSIDKRQFLISQAANVFYGLSLGSILLLAALGLAITFGLMGVINMAHGEMIMLGAYSTYVVQNLFKSQFSNWFDWYLILAIPTAFLVSALIGILMERTVLRYLYGRPLETLLATWGISLLIIQTVRLFFGAQNVEVANPSFLSGGMEVFTGVVFPYSRITIIIFVILVVVSVWAALQKTALGLQVRAVTQNRSMASCMGISSRRVDMWTFGLGSGVAGLGGVALSQIGNVGPELGQSYIVDSFMVVVLGGVGKIAGTLVGAVGLGMANKFLEPIAGAVLGKIIILALIILLIQKRPQGLFALKGRMAES